METQQNSNGLFSSRSGFVLIAFLVIIAFFLVTEHTAHLFGILPWLMLFACPFLHFLHGRHGRHSKDRKEPVNHAENPNHNPQGGKK
jgi:heme/copper-type cytochrome/quinol oxidase subunit 4